VIPKSRLGGFTARVAGLNYRAMTRAEIQKLLDLPADEKIELAQMLWESVEPEDEVRFLAIPGWQARILDERLADLDRNPDDEQTWDEVKAELRSSR
jgi:putative addiction module component (TIGR02574 family)